HRFADCHQRDFGRRQRRVGSRLRVQRSKLPELARNLWYRRSSADGERHARTVKRGQCADTLTTNVVVVSGYTITSVTPTKVPQASDATLIVQLANPAASTTGGAVTGTVTGIT